MSGSGKTGNGDTTTPAKVPGREPLRPPPPKRFYKSASFERSPSRRPSRGEGQGEGRQQAPAQGAAPHPVPLPLPSAGAWGEGVSFRILLDGRVVKTPKKRLLAVPTKALAEAIAGEWNAQGERIDPETMPLTRLANTAIDAVAGHMEDVAADIVAFAGSDLLCYRDESDERLALRQSLHWDKVLDWAQTCLGARLEVTNGVMPIEQPGEALRQIGAALEGCDAFELAALHVMTTLTGSAVLALAHAKRSITAEQAWRAAHVDEDFQIGLWGADAEAEARRAARWREFAAASRVVALVSADAGAKGAGPA